MQGENTLNDDMREQVIVYYTDKMAYKVSAWGDDSDQYLSSWLPRQNSLPEKVSSAESAGVDG